MVRRRQGGPEGTRHDLGHSPLIAANIFQDAGVHSANDGERPRAVIGAQSGACVGVGRARRRNQRQLSTTEQDQKRDRGQNQPTRQLQQSIPWIFFFDQCVNSPQPVQLHSDEASFTAGPASIASPVATGRHKATLLPTRRCLRTQTCPPALSMTALTIANSRPVPSGS